MSQSITNISLVAAFSAGLLSFVSPCVLPLVPSYVSYITGLSIEQLTIQVFICPLRIMASAIESP